VKALLLLSLIVSCSVTSLRAEPQGKTPFSADSAYANLEVLAGRIGPRPMGSPAEHRAMAFAVERFKQFGCQEAYVMPMTVASGVNTKSGVAIGILRGKTGRIIVIGGHIDSAGPDIPGANDDGSGAASVIELARVLSKTPHESTLMFCCWGGEEEGLRGSTFFTTAFDKIDSVDLMFQLDMVDGASTLDADPDGEYQTSAPTWLVEATFDAFYNELHHEGLVYPTQSATVNSSFSGATGSDHMPFLMAGIPAIDFTSDVDYPIHTPLDNLENFTPSGFTRAGDLVYTLVNRFDAGVPSRTTDKYWMVVIGHTPIAFSYPVLRTIAVISLLLGVFALIILRRRRPVVEPASRVRWSTLKLLLFSFVIQMFIWYSENVIGLIKGVRFPWAANVGWYILLGLASGSIGVWIVLGWTRRLKLSPDPYVYYLRAFVILSLLMVALSAANAELPIYPALTILLLVGGVLVRPMWLKGILALLAVTPMIRLVFLEYLGLALRLSTTQSPGSALGSLIRGISLPVLFTLYSIPLVYVFAAIYRSAEGDLFWLKEFRKRWGLFAAAGSTLVMAVIVIFRMPYNATWEPIVRIVQVATAGADSGSINMDSGEYLRGVRLSLDGKDTVIDANVTFAPILTARPASIPWLAIEETTLVRPAADDSLVSLAHTLILKNSRRPLLVTVAYRSDRKFELSSPWTAGGGRRRSTDSERQKTFTWYAFPDSTLIIPVTFSVRDTQKIRESIEVTYDSIAYPLTVHREGSVFTQRATVSASSTFPADTKTTVAAGEVEGTVGGRDGKREHD
jgi:hypothetical protein